MSTNLARFDSGSDVVCDHQACPPLRPSHPTATSIALMSVVCLIFGVPMILAAVLISPSALHHLVHGAAFYAVIALALPFIGWRTFLAVFAFPPSGNDRVAAVLTTWVGGTALVAAVFNLLIAVADYSPARPGPNPTAGFLLAGFVLCMFISSGVWGAVAPILPPKVAVGGALVTGVLLFLDVATLEVLASR